jgi:hypothetical protein
MTFWVRDGRLVGRIKRADGTDFSDKAQLEHFSAVKIDVDANGTTLQWHMASANWASLLYAVTFLKTLPSPYRMMYFNMGWIEETAADVNRLATRIEQLICKSDIHFSQRIYTKEENISLSAVPDNLRDAFESSAASEEDSVICNVDADRRVSSVAQVGENTVLAKIWGVSQVSFPCLSGNNYDRVVSESYFDAVKRNRPIYDHVLAVMVKPDGEHHWMGYQRVIIPDLTPGPRKQVRVMSAMAPVNINLI